MLRSEVNQRLLDLYAAPSYLEIGVFDGATFDAIRAPRKVAVDIRFLFDWQAAQARLEASGVTYHEMPSDRYFSEVNTGERFDVAFIDGLHTFDQTLRDLNNTLSRLRPGGVIVIDDVFPDSYVSSIPDLATVGTLRRMTNDPSASWMGDVYRLVFFIEAYLPAYSFAMVAENHGQLVLWQKARAVQHDRRVEDIARLPYEAAVLNKAAFNPLPFAEILELVRQDRERAGGRPRVGPPATMEERRARRGLGPRPVQGARRKPQES